MPDRDFLHRFPFERLAARGEIVQLDATWRAVLERRAYPPAVRRALGAAELRQTADQRGELHVSCEFCGHRYAFDAIDLAGLLSGAAPDASTARH